MPMGRLLRLAILAVVWVIAFSAPLFADGVHSFMDRADSFFDKPIHFTDTDSLSFGGHAFNELRTYGSSQDDWNWIGDPDDDHGKERRWHHHFHFGDGDGGGNFVDQDWDNDSNGGQTGSTGGMRDDSTAVPEPSVLVLLSAALVAFLLKSLSKAMV